ncbi:MAG: hypothetical protein VW378_06315 [bacterium]
MEGSRVAQKPPQELKVPRTTVVEKAGTAKQVEASDTALALAAAAEPEQVSAPEPAAEVERVKAEAAGTAVVKKKAELNRLERLSSLKDKTNRAMKEIPRSKAKMTFPEGSRVQVSGLKKATEHNGKVGIITQYIDDKNRYVVHLGGQALNIKPENLTLPSIPRFKKVRISGLPGSESGLPGSELNGIEVSCTGYSAAEQMCWVCSPQLGCYVAIPPENLTVIGEISRLPVLVHVIRGPKMGQQLPLHQEKDDTLALQTDEGYFEINKSDAILMNRTEQGQFDNFFHRRSDCDYPFLGGDEEFKTYDTLNGEEKEAVQKILNRCQDGQEWTFALVGTTMNDILPKKVFEGAFYINPDIKSEMAIGENIFPVALEDVKKYHLAASEHPLCVVLPNVLVSQESLETATGVIQAACSLGDHVMLIHTNQILPSLGVECLNQQNSGIKPFCVFPFFKKDDSDASLIVLPYNNPIKKLLKTLECNTVEEQNCLQDMLKFSQTYNRHSGLDAIRNSSIFELSQFIEDMCKSMEVEYEIKPIQALGEAFFKQEFEKMGFIEKTIPAENLKLNPNVTILSRVSTR